MGNKSKLVSGVGINDADYFVARYVDGKQVVCPIYNRWKEVLKRCYSDKFHKKQPTYIGCTVCEEWLTFSNFKKWMERQDWRGKEIDKDLLLSGNKVYSPETCVFIDGAVNNFISGGKPCRGGLKTGASFHKNINKFSSYCRNPISNKTEHLGFFCSSEDAHLAWKNRKHELACELACLQTDKRVVDALRTRYL